MGIEIALLDESIPRPTDPMRDLMHHVRCTMRVDDIAGLKLAESLAGLARIQWRGFHSVMAISASNDAGDLYAKAEWRRRGL
jgi:hypothetical protein